MKDSWGGAVILALLLGCTGGSSSDGSSSSGADVPRGSAREPQACSPLEGVTQPITIDKVVGAGRHADGTIYVLDEGRPDYRAFVSEGSVLQRKKVAGSGSAPDWVSVSVTDANGPFALKVEGASGVPTRMAVFRGEPKGKTFEIGAEGDVLELVDASTYASLAVRNIPGTVNVEYDTSTSDGRRIVVTRPEVDWSYEDFRVFFGTPERMVERPVRSVSRGSSTHITFDVDGVGHDAVFGSSLSPNLTSTLTVNGQRADLVDETARGVGLTYFCF
ncbi:MAG: hypothetical protein KF795_25325 [Labilithrix sp.]|nr:hypothetical protein [Labilithrix sp.]